MQLRERCSRLITRERVALNFTPRNSTQTDHTMTTEQGAMYNLGKEMTLDEELY